MLLKLGSIRGTTLRTYTSVLSTWPFTPESRPSRLRQRYRAGHPQDRLPSPVASSSCHVNGRSRSKRIFHPNDSVPSFGSERIVTPPRNCGGNGGWGAGSSRGSCRFLLKTHPSACYDGLSLRDLDTRRIVGHQSRVAVQDQSLAVRRCTGNSESFLRSRD
ncbi:hypothetical protein VTK26DRAFT_6264 [Humicola hyalothermophila]